MGTKYLVTGAAGHLGNAVVNQLVRDGQDVRALVLPGDKAAGRLPQGIELYRGDLLDKNSLQNFFKVADGVEVIVIHCAGIVSITSKFFQLLYDVNVTGAKNIVDICLAARVKKLVHVSSVHAIPELHGRQLMSEIENFDPAKVHGPYAKTKAEATAYVLEVAKKGLNVSVVFPGGICGPGDYGKGHMTQLLIDFCQGRLPAAIRGGYDFVDVRDVANGIISCCAKGRPGEGYILTGRYVSVAEMVELFHTITGKKRTKIFLPIWIVKAALPFLTVYYKLMKQPPLFSAYSLYTLKANSNFSHEKAVRELGYTVRPFIDTIADTVKWLKDEGRISNLAQE